MSTQQQTAIRYGHARSEDSERWRGNEASIADAIFDALTSDDIESPAPVFVCECRAPSISYARAADLVIEDVEEQLYEEVGEIADTLGPFEPSEVAGLTALIAGWFEKHNAISCWKAENIKRYAPGDAEYDEALAIFTAAEGAA